MSKKSVETGEGLPKSRKATKFPRRPKVLQVMRRLFEGKPVDESNSGNQALKALLESKPGNFVSEMLKLENLHAARFAKEGRGIVGAESQVAKTDEKTADLLALCETVAKECSQ